MATKKLKKIELRFVELAKNLGSADREDMVILVDPRQEPKDKQNTIIHEWLHIRFPKMTEKEVLKHADDLNDLLWQCGVCLNENSRITHGETYTPLPNHIRE